MSKIKSIPETALGERVNVYKNLHNGLWSVQSMETGRVIGHANAVELREVSFVVQPAGRRKVLEEQKKNVHAFARGRLEGLRFPEGAEGAPVTYNPYKAGHFYVRDTGERIDRADRVALGVGVWALN